METFQHKEVLDATITNDVKLASSVPMLRIVDENKPLEVDDKDVKKNVMSNERRKHDEDMKSISFIKLFAFADSFDYLLLTIGSMGATIHGCGLPIFALIFGKILHGIGANANNPSVVSHIVNKVTTFNVLLFLPHSCSC